MGVWVWGLGLDYLFWFVCCEWVCFVCWCVGVWVFLVLLVAEVFVSGGCSGFMFWVCLVGLVLILWVVMGILCGVVGFEVVVVLYFGFVDCFVFSFGG